MKKHLLPLILGLAGVFTMGTAFGRDNVSLDEPEYYGVVSGEDFRLEEDGFSARVEKMWRAGDYAGVMALAQERLAADSNDLAGLLLKHEYELEFLQVDAAIQSAKDIVAVASQIGTERFAQVRELVVEDARSALELLPNYPPEAFANDLLKAGTVTNKALPCVDALRALEADGFFRDGTGVTNGTNGTDGTDGNSGGDGG